MEIGGLQKVTLIDYPGRIAATIFLIGCEFKCPWCYARELVLPKEIKKQPRISEKEFFNHLKERKGLLEGVVMCGGEPTINKKLPSFIQKIKKLGYSVKLDTNGSNPKMLKKLIDEKLIDYVAMDIKAPKEKYKKIFGKRVKIEDIEKSIKILKEGKVDYEFRSTVVPTVLNKEDILKMQSREKDKAEAMHYFKKAIKKLDLPMKPVDAHFSLDGGRITFAFIADGRVDFRELVKDLTKHFQKSIRLQQLGIRDEAKVAGDYGPCGQLLCCKRFLKELGNVTSELVALQQVSHRGSERLSGCCGRLKCCMAYEQYLYDEMAKGLPPIGSEIKTDKGKGKVIGWHTLKQTVDVQLNEDNVIIEHKIK